MMWPPVRLEAQLQLLVMICLLLTSSRKAELWSRQMFGHGPIGLLTNGWGAVPQLDSQEMYCTMLSWLATIIIVLLLLSGGLLLPGLCLKHL